MASIGAVALTSNLGWTFAAGGFGLGLLGFAVVAGAGYLDQRYIYPSLLGDKEQTRPKPLVGLPQTTSSPGTPRVWAIGRRVRVPLHVMFQSDKAREDNVGGSKGGQPQVVRRVFSDVGLSVNDRVTARLMQIAANGQLVYWQDRNLVQVTTHEMTATVIGSTQVQLTMNSALEPDFNDYFKLEDLVALRGFNSTGQAHLGTGDFSLLSWWEVVAVTKHGTTPSSITLEPVVGQTVSAISNLVAGDALFPGAVVRLDDVWMPRSGATLTQIVSYFGVPQMKWSITFANDDDEVAFERFARSNFAVYLYHYNWGSPAVFNVKNTAYVNAQRNWLESLGGVTGGAIPVAFVNTGNQRSLVVAQTAIIAAPGMFAADPLLNYNPGGEDSTEDDIIARHKTTGEIPGFRGMAYQMLDQWDLSTYFGNQIPPIIEGIIEPDFGMTVAQAVAAVCSRAELEDEITIDTSGITTALFNGYYLQGAVSTVQALQPLMIAYQLLAQERGRRIAFFDIGNADVIQVENGASFSDLGVTSGSQTPNAGDKLRLTQADMGDLPTTLGIRHQDPDQQYSVGYQHFAQRQPTPLQNRNEQDIDLSSLVLTRKQARNLAATMMRRTWVNSQAVEMQLPVAYLEACENDLLTLTDDEGNDYTVRILRREIGNNFVVNVAAVVEDINLAVSGSPVQQADQTVPQIVAATVPEARVMDIPPLDDGDGVQPGYYVAACSPAGQGWSGCAVYESRDSGTTWRLVETLQQQCGMGTTLSGLPLSATIAETTAGGPFWDTSSTLDVDLEREGIEGQLITVTEADVLAGWNWALVDDGTTQEVIGFRDVTLNANGTYTLSHLLRGLRGTYNVTTTAPPAAGAKFTLLFLARQTEAIKFVPLNVNASGLPVSVQVRFVPPGRALNDAELVTYTVSLTGRNARPMPLRDVSSTITTGNDREIKFNHWSRLNYPVGYTGPFTLDESFEGYEVQILDPTASSVVRTKKISARGTGSPTLLVNQVVPYPASEQTADGYTPGPSATFFVEARQLGDFGDSDTFIVAI